MKPVAWHREHYNKDRKWVFLDEEGNEVRREYLPV